MTYISPKIYRLALCIVLLLNSAHVNAQISVIQNLIGKFESYKNFSYQSINKRKDMSVDTTVAFNKELFLKAPDDKQFGYYYSIETDHKTETFHRIDLYNGDGINVLSPSDTSFFPDKESVAYNQSLIGGLMFLKSYYSTRPFPIKMLQDTVINGVTNTHIVANLSDTIDNNEHLYSRSEFYIDKQTGLPTLVTGKSRYKFSASGPVNDYYDETKYFNYKVNEPDVTLADFTVPNTFHPRKKQPVQPPLLTSGTIAPDWTLYDVSGNRVSLSQMKGKVVMLDFYFIGCSGCMASINPLNTIYEKYKNKDVIIASLTERDGKKAVTAFEKTYKIKYPGYIGAADVVKAYHVGAFPTFYLIDKEGNIASVIDYNDDFEQKVTATIDKLLSK